MFNPGSLVYNPVVPVSLSRQREREGQISKPGGA
jgi:hypothetical protein